MEPKACIPTPQGNGESSKELFGGSGSPVLLLMARLMEVMVWTVSSARPPRVSATRGMNSMPTERRAERLEASLCCTPTWRAWPGVTAASEIVSWCRELIKVTSCWVAKAPLREENVCRAC